MHHNKTICSSSFIVVFFFTGQYIIMNVKSFLIVILLSPLLLSAQMESMSRKEYRRYRHGEIRRFNDSLFDRGKLFAQHNLYFATEGIFNFLLYDDGANTYLRYRLAWRPVIGYFPVKRLLIGIQPGVEYQKGTRYTSTTGQFGVLFRYYAGKRRVTFMPEVGYYLTNTYYSTRRGAFEFPPANSNEYKMLKHYAFIGAGLNVRVWTYLSFNYSVRTFFLLKQVSDNDRWNLDQNWGISFTFPTIRHQIGQKLFAYPKFTKYKKLYIP